MKKGKKYHLEDFTKGFQPFSSCTEFLFLDTVVLKYLKRSTHDKLNIASP